MEIIVDAEANYKKGQQYLKRSLFNIFPDYLEATEYFIKALKIYKLTKLHDKVYDTTLLIVNCYEKVGLYKKASLLVHEAMKGSVSMSNDQKLHILTKAIHYTRQYKNEHYEVQFHTLQDLFRYSPSIQIKTEIITEFIEDIDDVYKIELYRPYVTELLHNNLLSQTKQIYTHMISIYTKINQSHNTNKIILSSILIYILENDIVGAEKEYDHYFKMEFWNSDECDIARDLLHTIKNNDPLDTILTNYKIQTLEHILVQKLIQSYKNTDSLA